jgi:hypothetical protein
MVLIKGPSRHDVCGGAPGPMLITARGHQLCPEWVGCGGGVGGNAYCRTGNTGLACHAGSWLQPATILLCCCHDNDGLLWGRGTHWRPLSPIITSAAAVADCSLLQCRQAGTGQLDGMGVVMGRPCGGLGRAGWLVGMVELCHMQAEFLRVFSVSMV